MKTLSLLLASLLVCGIASAALPSSINNDDSCDIKVGPAATLLLPYFEVDVAGNSGRTTLFTVTNVTRYPQIAHVTLWTDWAYPVLTFNLYLTGYDVQSINLADVLVRDTVAPPTGTNSASVRGPLSASTNPNLRSPLDCASNPGMIPETIMVAVRNALRTGYFGLLTSSSDSQCNSSGGVHVNAVGYATIDVVASCTNRMPSDPLYYSTDLLFDNVLVGDYQQLAPSPEGASSSAFDAAGNPLVHIRAVPEGGGAGSQVGTALPYTFYDRYTPATGRTLDRRQPLPSTFAARVVQGGPATFATNLTIWREGRTGSNASCLSFINNDLMTIGEVVRFDEHENANSLVLSPICDPCSSSQPVLPATSATRASNDVYPVQVGTDAGGWFYLDLNNGGSTAYSVTRDIGGAPGPSNAPTSLGPFGSSTTIGPRPSQNWVTVTMFGSLGANHLTAEFDAAALGNGCTPAAFKSVVNTSPAIPLEGAPPIGPAGGVFVCPPGTTLTNGSTAQCTGTNVNPIP